MNVTKVESAEAFAEDSDDLIKRLREEQARWDGGTFMHELLGEAAAALRGAEARRDKERLDWLENNLTAPGPAPLLQVYETRLATWRLLRALEQHLPQATYIWLAGRLADILGEATLERDPVIAEQALDEAADWWRIYTTKTGEKRLEARRALDKILYHNRRKTV